MEPNYSNKCDKKLLLLQKLEEDTQSSDVDIYDASESGIQETTSSYNPERYITSIKIPIDKPHTQSVFYMPPIAEAFYIAKGVSVPQVILNAGGIILGLGLKNNPTHKLINKNQYNLMIEAIVQYLKQANNLFKLENQFMMDRYPSKDSGHISGKDQEILLNNIIIPGIQMFGGSVNAQIFLESAITQQYGY